MLFKSASRSDAEKVFVVVKNVSGGTLTGGYSCVWDTSTADGVRVTQNAATTLTLFAGVADADIANNGYGLIQVYGYRSSAYISYSSVSIVIGDALGAGLAANWGLERKAAGSAGSAVAYAAAMEAVASSTAVAHYTTAKVFIRAL
ncbi:hypothetical protein [Desulfobacter sp. UBA2225]|jgi:hypothetical protein|uniref:hypothetical protein n=1 Tax=Desulfobacter sp. UBA2225 TaxID=1961413 RepID=UPI00257DF014|nr:hypothetical protein [Desulfobacter sp. UBA2225]